MNNDFIVVSFYTKGTGYQDHAAKFIESLIRLNVPHRVEGINSLGNWYANTQFKALYIREMLEAYPIRPVVWIDCDAIIHSYPAMFKIIDCDLAAHYRSWRLNPNELLTGTLFIANNDIMHKVVDEWIEENAKNPTTWDQKNLQKVTERHALRIHKLPADYCKIFDQPMGAGSPVIEHFQASRQLKHKVTKGVT